MQAKLSTVFCLWAISGRLLGYWLVDTESLTHLTSFTCTLDFCKTCYSTLPSLPPTCLFMERQWDFFVYDTLYAILFVCYWGLPIWFTTTLSVASVISLNKTQFITHSRVFSLLSSFPFRCYPTVVRYWIPCNSFVLFFDNCNFLSICYKFE